MLRLLQSWYEDHRFGAFDLLALCAACVLTCGLVFGTPLADQALSLVRERWGWHVEPLLLCLAITWFFLAVFAWRRWKDVVYLLGVAETDPLTKLENRRKILRVLNNEFERARRYKRSLSLVIFDIDHFKLVNDNHGHPVGDMVLKAIARRLKRKMRGMDHFGRWGGEEFILICPETDEESAVHIAERMRRTVNERNIGRVGRVSASFGVSTLREVGDCNALIEEADQLLYIAKQSGRNCVKARLSLRREANLKVEGTGKKGEERRDRSPRPGKVGQTG